MIKRIRYSGIFFGWWTVIVTGIISGLGHGFYGYGISVFFKDLSVELSLTRAVTSIASGIGQLQGGISSPLVGWLSDRFGPKWIILFGILIAATGMVMMNFITTMWTYFVVWGLMTGVGLNIGLTIAIDKTLTDWFVRKRGLAQGIKFALIGIGGVIALPIVTWLVTTHGWRTTCLIWGIVMLIFAPLILYFVKQKRPEYYGLLPDGAKVDLDKKVDHDEIVDQGIEYASSFQETEFTFKQAIRTPAYWSLVIVFAIQSINIVGFRIHTIPFLTDMGINQLLASGMMGVMVFFTVPARFLGGFIGDHVGRNRLRFLLAGAFTLQLIGLVTFLLNQSIPATYALLILFGSTGTACTPIFIIIIGRYFGRKAFGSIFGSTMLFRAPISLFGPVVTGWIYDIKGDYILAFVVFGVISAFAVLLLFLTHPPKLPSTLS